MTKFDRFAPPGFNWQRELKWICAGLSAATLLSLQFFSNYRNFLNTLYRWDGHVKKLYEGAVLADFHVIVQGCFSVFWVVALCAAATVVLHYAYHYQGAKSIYLMRRLPSRRELHVRCFAIPLAAILACLVLVFILLMIYYVFYILRTPNICLAPNQLPKLFNAWMGV